MAQQQNQSKLGSMKPNPIKKAVKGASKFTPLYGGSLLAGKQIGKPLKSFGKGFGGEPMNKKQMKTKMSPKKKTSAPSYAKVQKSIKKTMGY